MSISAIARIECYKHYQAGNVRKEALRELTGYKNPNWHKELSFENVYLECMEIDKPFEKWIYEYREKNNIVGRYLEKSTNPKSETNAMCQALFTVPKYIDNLPREEQIKVLQHCYIFFKKEFPEVPILEAVIHFDETSPHLHINFLPVIEREHKKRGKEKIFSTTLLMPGKDYFPKFQDRFYEYMQEVLNVELERKKGSKVKHLAPKEYRELTSEIKHLEEEKEKALQEVREIKEDCSVWINYLNDIKSSSVFDKTLKLYERIRDLERQNKVLKSAVDYLTSLSPQIKNAFNRFMEKFGFKSANIDKER